MRNPVIHELKTWKEYFTATFRGDKNLELRKNDRDFKVMDQVILKEYDNLTNEYTGRILHREISYILYDNVPFGIEEGYCIMSIRKI